MPSTIWSPLAASWVAFVLSLAALAAAYLGMGLPNHTFQVALAVGCSLLGLHRGWFWNENAKLRWIQFAVNVALFAELFKLVIGGGITSPFSWLKYPSVSITGPEKWSLLPHWNLNWEPTIVSHWQLDVTTLQTLLLILTLGGAIVRFQPFASLLALFLLLVSLPNLASFNWDYVFWALLLGSASFYLQGSFSALRVAHHHRQVPEL